MQKPRLLESNKGGYQGGVRPAGAATQRTREIANQEAESGRVLPLEVMLDNMRFYHDLAQRLTLEVLDMPDSEKVGASFLMKLKRIISYRANSQACARDAAPYQHPTLKSIEHTGNANKPIILQLVKDDMDL